MPIVQRLFLLILWSILVLGQGACSVHQTSGATSTGAQLVHHARQLVGTPYRYGGNDIGGFDCSGLVQFTYSRIGILIPRTTRAQLARSQAIKPAEMRPGDLLFFRLKGPKVSHVGIYIGNQKMIHAPSNHKSVSYARLDQGYWRDHLVAIGRFH
jgi:cell wall-associated NlpC family hydrolase